MCSYTSAVLYLDSLVVKSRAPHTFKSAGIGPPLDSSPPGGSAPFAGRHDNMILLYSLQTCQTATNKGPRQPLYNRRGLYERASCPSGKTKQTRAPRSKTLCRLFKQTSWRAGEQLNVIIIRADRDRCSLQPNREIKTLIRNYKYASTLTVYAAMVKVSVSSKP